MAKIGQYDYPTLTTFTETLEIATEALNRYGGFMPYLSITQKLGYNVKNPAGISGYIYRRFDEMCAFGLFGREKGGVRTTELAKEALDPYDAERARLGKKKSISKFPILAKAITDWKGRLPDQDAFPAKLAELASVDWVEAKKHSEILQKLISDCFTYIKPAFETVGSGVTASATETIGGFLSGTIPTSQMSALDREEKQAVTQVGSPFGELRTLVGTVVIKNMATLRLARSTLDVLEGEIKEQETEKKMPRESKSGKGSGEETKAP